MKKLFILLISILIFFTFLASRVFAVNTISIKCPQRTIANKNNIIFVGKVDSLGNDKYVEGWFEYGSSSSSLMFKTKSIKLSKPGIYCINVNKLKKCTTYYYRAVAKNSAGINYGEIRSIKTKCK